MHEELVNILLYDAGWLEQGMTQTEHDIAEHLRKAASAIENLNCQRNRAYVRLCEWCGVCPEGKRNAEDCEIAALNPELPKEENND